VCDHLKPEQSPVIFMKFVPAQFIADEKCDENEGRQTERKSENIDKGERLVPHKISCSNLENVFEHS